jgi:aconitate hydratase
VKVVLVKSFARIHETNLKKQGMLGLTFVNKADYDLIQEDDRFDVIGLSEFQPNVDLKLRIHHINGEFDEIDVTHSYNESQIEWFKAGSALNLIRSQNH